MGMYQLNRNRYYKAPVVSYLGRPDASTMVNVRLSAGCSAAGVRPRSDREEVYVRTK